VIRAPYRRPVLALITILAVLGLSSVSWAMTHPPSEPAASVIRACVLNKQGNLLRLVEPGQGCPKGDRLLTWNVTGPRGPQGSTGATGPTGLVWKGAWTSQGTYAPTDVVSYGGSSWVAVQQSANSAPGEGSSDWSLLAQVGAQGPQGPAATLPSFLNDFGHPAIPNGSTGSTTTTGTPGCVLGAVWLFAGLFAPSGTHVADGTLLPIDQNQALFSIIGTLYGGNGTTNFALPNLQPLAPNGVSYVICTSGVFPSH
jgi:hypothetical protein